jgi:hypothetical protein
VVDLSCAENLFGLVDRVVAARAFASGPRQEEGNEQKKRVERTRGEQEASESRDPPNLEEEEEEDVVDFWKTDLADFISTEAESTVAVAVEDEETVVVVSEDEEEEEETKRRTTTKK